MAAAVKKLFQLTGPSRAVEPPQLKHLQQPVCIRSRSGTAEESASAVAAAAAAAAAVVVTVVAAAADLFPSYGKLPRSILLRPEQA